MSLWSILFPDVATRRQRLQEEAELARMSQDRHNTLRAVEISARGSSRLMETYAGAMQMMARENDEDL